jgi:hypothetical protein
MGTVLSVTPNVIGAKLVKSVYADDFKKEEGTSAPDPTSTSISKE